MANRYQSDDRWRRERAYGRQEEQFQPRRNDEDTDWYGQMGDSWRDYGEQQTSWRDREDRYERGFGGERDYRPARYDRGSERRFDSVSGRDLGNRDYSGPRRGSGTSYAATGYGAGSQLAANHGEWHEPSREYSDYRGTWGGLAGERDRNRYRERERDERGFLERAGDTLAHWLGDDADYRRGDRGYRGRGPANYTRSDDRIREDACDRLTDDWSVDASRIEVSVSEGEVTLSGTVPNREQKRRAEDCVDDLSGVRHVQNNLRVEDTGWDYETTGSRSNPTSSQA